MPATPATSPAACRHCGAPLRGAGAFETRGFCCAGCEIAAGLVAPDGLCPYVAGLEEDGPDDGVAYGALDDPAVEARATEALAGGRRRVRFRLSDLRCASCVWLLERLPSLVGGVLEARVRLHPASIEVTYRRPATLGAVARMLARLGYAPRLGDGADETDRAARRADLARIGVAGACAGNAMLLAAALYLGDAYGMGAQARSLLRSLSAVVGLVAIAGPGRVFLRGAASALATRTPHMDLPVALGLVVGAAAGTINVLRGAGAIYFDTLSVLVFLLLVGRSLQSWQQRCALSAVAVLRQLVPAAARRFEDGRWRTVPSSALRPGDRVRVDAEAVFPADGVVTAGEGAVDASLLTGETRPVAVAPGSPVHAGTVNAAGPLEVLVERVGEATRLGRIGALVEQAATTRARLVRAADRIGAGFVVAVTALAAVTFAVWWPESPSLAVEHAVALLVVACPCALGLATPLAVAAAAAAGARAGIFVRDADALEALRGARTVLFDKTGTLTEARPSVARYLGDPGARGRAVALEQGIAHPVARAVAASSAPPSVRVARVETGRGLQGVAGVVDGRPVAVGSAAYLASRGVPIEGPLAEAWAAHRAAGRPAVGVAEDGRLAGVFLLDHAVRPGARALVDALRGRGVDVAIVSGDVPEVVRSVGRALGLGPRACHGDVSPEGKLALVRTRRRPVVVVGDGVNDAIALRAADVGIAVGGGAEAALRAAAVFCDRPGIEPVRAVFALADRTWAVVRRNLLVSLAYNAVAVGLAMAGAIGPLSAAVLMPASSMTVVALTLAGLGRWRP